MDYEEADKRVKEADERADRIEAYIKTKSDEVLVLEKKELELERKAKIAEMVYDMACASGGNEALREKMIDVMYENEQLKAENSKLRELLDKFLESIGQVVEMVRNGFIR